GRRRGADRTALLAPLDPRRTRPELGAQRPRARDLRPRLRPRGRVPPVRRPLPHALGDDVRGADAPRDPAGALLRRRAGAPPHATPRADHGALGPPPLRDVLPPHPRGHALGLPRALRPRAV